MLRLFVGFVSAACNLMRFFFRFTLIKEHLIEFNQLAMANSSGSDDMLNRVMPRDNIGLAALLKTNETAWENCKCLFFASISVVFQLNVPSWTWFLTEGLFFAQKYLIFNQNINARQIHLYFSDFASRTWTGLSFGFLFEVRDVRQVYLCAYTHVTEKILA